MTNPNRTLLQSIEGPNGKVDVYEVEESPAGGTIETRYEVRSGDKTHETVRALGHAYIVAEELAGVKS
jgi:hypothetical protein